MAQPLIKFFRVASLPATGTPGALYFVSGEGVLYVCTGETSFEAYAGIKTAALDGSVLTLTPSVGNAISVDIATLAQGAIDLSGYVKKTQTIADIDLQDNITTEELQEALNLGTAAYKAVEDFDAAGAAEAVKTALVNGETEFTDFKAVGDELRALDLAAGAKVADVTVGGTSVVNAEHVAVLGTAAGKTIEDFDAAGAASKALEDAKKYTDEAKAAVIGDATEAGNTLGKLEDRIETIVANEKTYSIAKVESGLGENVKEAYKLVDEKGTQVGETINIYKDSSLISVDLVDEKPAETEGAEATKGQFIKYTYVLATGAESVQYVDVSRLLVEAEFKDGLEVSAAGEVSVKVDAASEAFLTVSEAGVKLSGVQTAIDTAAAKATTVVVEGTDAGNNLSIVESTAADGHSIYTVNLTDVASAQGLSDLATVVNDNEHVTAAALNDLNERIEAVADSIPTELGVMSVAKGTDGKFVTTTIGGTAANPTVGVAVNYTESTAEATALATDAYVQEQIAASALTWQLF